MIQFKAGKTTNPSKLASAIAHNIKNSDITIGCAGNDAVNNTVKALIVAKMYIQNEDFTLKFDFESSQEVDVNEEAFSIVKVIVSKEDK